MNTLNHSLTSLGATTTPPSGWVWALAIGFTLICIIMMLVVLIQKPKGGGLSGAFGGGAGGGNTQALLGSRVGDFLTWTTVVCFLLFLGLAMGMTWMIHGSEIDEDDEQAEVESDDKDGASSDEDKDD
ncbi:MAG: preprotein translocase subunit SecG [Phycisphaeraceae bacterium]